MFDSTQFHLKFETNKTNVFNLNCITSIIFKMGSKFESFEVKADK